MFRQRDQRIPLVPRPHQLFLHPSLSDRLWAPLRTDGTQCQTSRNQLDPRRIGQSPQVCLPFRHSPCLRHLLPQGPLPSHPPCGHRLQPLSRHLHKTQSQQCSGRCMISDRLIRGLRTNAVPPLKPCQQTLMLLCLQLTQAPPLPRRTHQPVPQWIPPMQRQSRSTMTTIPVYAAFASMKCRTGNE